MEAPTPGPPAAAEARRLRAELEDALGRKLLKDWLELEPPGHRAKAEAIRRFLRKQLRKGFDVGGEGEIVAMNCTMSSNGTICCYLPVPLLRHGKPWVSQTTGDPLFAILVVHQEVQLRPTRSSER